MRAVVVGAVGSTEVLLKELQAAPGWTVPLVVTLPDDLFGRHSDIVDLKPLADALGASMHRTGKSNDSGTLDAIADARPDYVFVVGWSQICGPDFLALKPGKVIGYHPAPLPRLRGRAAIPWTILLDEKITAGSLFWLAEGTDDGDLLAQHYFHLASDETAEQLYAKHMDALAVMLKAALPQLAAGAEPRTPQDPRYATWATKRTPADGKIDWSRPAVEIDRLVRAVGQPYPGAFTVVDGRKLTVWQSRVLADDGRFHAMVGQVVAQDGGQLIVQTGAGLLELCRWDIDGDKGPRMHQVLGDG